MADALTGMPLCAVRCTAWLATIAARDAAAAPQPGCRAHVRHLFATRRRVAAFATLAMALLLGTSAGWIHAKALLAQVLLHNAWTQTLASGTTHAPWPWADTAPVARLRVAARDIDQIVLRGDSGRTLAFGPGWAEASAAPGEHGTVVLSGHRDTHFAFLRDLQPGEAIELQGTQGNATYRVVDTRIADVRRDRLALDAGQDELWLVTCWPFDAVTAGGPLRYAVRTVRIDALALAP